MSILQSCCCWRSVRRGSFACAIYTAFYYSMIMVTIATVLQEESQYLAGNRSSPKSNSVLEKEVSPVTMRFNIVLLTCSCCGVVCCLMLLYGLFKDEKKYLVPWILIVIVCTFVDLSHLAYLFFFVTVAFNPVTALLFATEFFLLCLNTNLGVRRMNPGSTATQVSLACIHPSYAQVYSLLCVISQYQEYAAGRGTASDDCEHRQTPSARYIAQPTTTATSCLSSRRSAPTINETRATTATPTPTQSPINLPAQLTIERSPSGERPARKHVQFIPDTMASNGHDRTDDLADAYLNNVSQGTNGDATESGNGCA